MKIVKRFKDLKWLLDNKEEIEKKLKTTKKSDEKRYSLEGVPEFQRQYVDDLLSKSK